MTGWMGYTKAFRQGNHQKDRDIKERDDTDRNGVKLAAHTHTRNPVKKP